MDTNCTPPLPVERPRPDFRKIGGFWLRFLAFFIDGVLLGLVGLVAGFFLFDTLVALGGWGRLVGLLIALPYAGILNSAAGKGQTIGKRIVGIEVLDARGQHIPLGRSLLRSSIIGVPFFLNGALLPPSVLFSPAGYLVGFLVFGAGGAIFYLIIFNRRSRQSLHDLLVGTFVVRTGGAGVVAASPVWRGHYAVVGVWCLLVVGFAVASPLLAKTAVFADLLAVQAKLQASGKVHMATVFVGKNWSMINGTKREISYLQSTAIWKSRPSNNEAAARDIAAIIMANYPDIAKLDALVVTVSYGYDIGIARAWRTDNFQHSPQQWSELLAATK